MSITLQHSPVLKVKDINNGGKMEVSGETTISALLERLGIPSDQHRYLLVYANGKKQGLSYILKNGDALQLFLPIGGG